LRLGELALNHVLHGFDAGDAMTVKLRDGSLKNQRCIVKLLHQPFKDLLTLVVLEAPPAHRRCDMRVPGDFTVAVRHCPRCLIQLAWVPTIKTEMAYLMNALWATKI
jgi:hypothetical protein